MLKAHSAPNIWMTIEGWSSLLYLKDQALKPLWMELQELDGKVVQA